MEDAPSTDAQGVVSHGPPHSSDGTLELGEPAAVEPRMNSPSLFGGGHVEPDQRQSEVAELHDRLTRAEVERDRIIEGVKGVTEQRDAGHAAVEDARKILESGWIELAVRSAEVATQSKELSEVRRELAPARSELARIRDALQKC